MGPCGRIRKKFEIGQTSIVDGELENLQVSVLSLEAGKSFTLQTVDKEFAIVLIQGECHTQLAGGEDYLLGPRGNPFDDLPYALFATKEETITFKAKQNSLLGIGCAPAEKKTVNTFIDPKKVSIAVRGEDNWEREVRKVCWSDNTEGNLLLVGETCTPSGNWSSIPPHRHQYHVPGSEVPYEEVYLFKFSAPQGFGLIWQFDDETGMDQAFSVKENDVVYTGHGYHPVVCAPGMKLYHLTLMAGPFRQSQASVHPDFQFLLDDKGLENQFTPKK